MPVRKGQDERGCYYQWGSAGKRYYYPCGDRAAAMRAYVKAREQGEAARAAGYDDQN